MFAGSYSSKAKKDKVSAKMTTKLTASAARLLIGSSNEEKREASFDNAAISPTISPITRTVCMLYMRTSINRTKMTEKARIIPFNTFFFVIANAAIHFLKKVQLTKAA